jgi:hypothetical protein
LIVYSKNIHVVHCCLRNPAPGLSNAYANKHIDLNTKNKNKLIFLLPTKLCFIFFLPWKNYIFQSIQRYFANNFSLWLKKIIIIKSSSIKIYNFLAWIDTKFLNVECSRKNNKNLDIKIKFLNSFFVEQPFYNILNVSIKNSFKIIC